MRIVLGISENFEDYFLDMELQSFTENGFKFRVINGAWYGHCNLVNHTIYEDYTKQTHPFRYQHVLMVKGFDDVIRVVGSLNQLKNIHHVWKNESQRRKLIEKKKHIDEINDDIPF